MWRGGDRRGRLDQAVRQRRLAVIDVRDDAEVADPLRVEGGGVHSRPDRTTVSPAGAARYDRTGPCGPRSYRCTSANLCVRVVRRGGSGRSGRRRSRATRGLPRVQMSIAIGQRVWKLQPGGGAIGLGTSPVRIRRSRRRSNAGSGIGTAEISAWVYGCSGFSYSRSELRELDDLAQVHHRNAVRDVPHHRQVVRDEQVGQTEVRLQGPRAG